MAVPALKTQVLNEIMRTLKEDINYQVQDGDDGVTLTPDAIVFQITRATKNRPDVQQNQLNDLPALIVSSPLRSPTDEAGGTVTRDLNHYMWLIQCVDSDQWQSPGRLATWDKWIEQIIAILMFNCLNNSVVLPYGQVWWATASRTGDVDEKVFIQDGMFIETIAVEVKVLQPRGVVI